MSKVKTFQARKKETRDKIELGGLVVKAGLRSEMRSLLLGALIDLRKRLEDDDRERQRLTAIGEKAFGKDDA